MPMAPRGAVIKMDTTATVKIFCPLDKPIDSGIAPMAACTVALGVYATIQNNFSFFSKLVFNKHIKTPTILNISAHKTMMTADVPAFVA